MNPPSSDPSAPLTVHATADSHFSWIRTRMSVENTLLAWVRTSTSLIGFGFTIVQFFQRFQDIPGTKPPIMPGAPRYVGLALIFAGVVAMAISLLQYNALNRYLESGSFKVLAAGQGSRYRSATPGMAMLVFAIGLFAFFGILLRLD